MKVVIVDDHQLFAESLEIALTIERYTVRRAAAGSSGSLAATTTAVLRQRPDIVLLDLDLGHLGDGVALVGPLTEAGAAVVVVTASTDRGRWGECVEAGALKVISKSGPLDEILATVRRVATGVPVMSRDERTELLRVRHQRQLEQQELRGRLLRLSARERDVLGHLTLGRTVNEIASRETVSPATVRTQVKSILAKLEVSSQIAAVGIAHQVGWRSPVS